MLHSLTIRNFRSIRDEQELDCSGLNAGMNSRLNIIGNRACGSFIPVTVLFGANASGKSNVLDALAYIRVLVRESADYKVDEPMENQAFALDRTSLDKESAFSVKFSTTEREYQYSFAIAHGCVKSEELIEYVKGPKRRSQRRLFSRHRSESPDRPIIKISENLPGQKKAIISATRDNMLFLSKAAKENFQPLLDAFRWFVPSYQDADALDLFDEDSQFRAWILHLFEAADLGVTGIRIQSPRQVPIAASQSSTEENSETGELAQYMQYVHTTFESIARRERRPTLSHRVVLDDTVVEKEIPWFYESLGTKQLWKYAAGLYTSLRDGSLLMFDEITGLHPLLLREIISLYQQENTNSHGAQLLFSSHDTALLGNWGGTGYVLDRDEIWFTEKGYDGATQLYPLTDFSPRDTEDIEKRYLQGRYGSTPILGELTIESE